MNATDDLVERYLNEVCWAMGGRFAEQQAARDELQGHIRDAVADLELQGHVRREAVALALRSLGEAEAVGRALRDSRGRTPLQRPVAQPSGAVLIERRRAYRVPQPRVVLALGASALALAVATLIYLWPR